MLLKLSWLQPCGCGRNSHKDFSAIIEQAKTCPAPTEIETGTIVGGFAHEQVFALADKVVDAVKSGAIKSSWSWLAATAV